MNSIEEQKSDASVTFAFACTNNLPLLARAAKPKVSLKVLDMFDEYCADVGAEGMLQLVGCGS